MNTAPLRLLIAEDEAAHVEAIRRAFETAGAKVDLRAVANLREYRACIAEWTPDLALVDLNLPDGRAVEVLTHPPEDALFPVLVMTAFGNQEIVVEVMKAGALDYVVKSLEAFAALPCTVERAFREWQLLRGHKQLVEALKKSEAKHGKMVANIGDVIVIIDQDGINRYKSSNIERLFGWRPEEVVGADALDKVHPEDRDQARKFIGALFREPHATGQTECRYRCKDGHYKWIEFRGVNLAHDPDIQGLLGNYHDITERKQAEEALRESEKKYRVLVETTGTGFLILNNEGKVIDANAEYVRLTGHCELGDILGKTVIEWTADYDRNNSSAAVAQCVKVGFIKNVVVDYIDRNGRITPVEVNAAIIGTGESMRIVALCRDITDRRRIENELQKMDKLQSIGVLAGGIAHDFNNVLLGLYGNISIAMDDLSKEHPSYAPLEEAEKSMTRAVRLTKQLLTFAKGGDPVKESVSLGTMIEEVARFDLTGSNVSLVYHHDEDLWPVDADRGQLQQVVSNLVINARQAMPKGGHLTITLENADHPSESVPGLRAGRYVKVMVQDTGGGIEPKVLGHIFDPYFTTKQTGSGLGLATVWSIITKHGGHIGVVSELGKGTTFTFYLPASTALLPAKTKPPAAEGPAPARLTKLLVMDDDDMICDLASKMLARCGYTVETAPGGQEALALYRQALESGAPFDAVIMDLTIPGGPGGKEVIKDLLALDPRVHAIVSSGYADDPVMANPSAYGFQGTVAKPYTARALREAVARVLA